MQFYSSPLFFIALAVAVVPAAVLGLTGRRIAPYGFAASCVFLVLLFWGDLQSAAALLAFLVVAFACMHITLASWKKGEKSLAKYRLCLALTIAPLVIYKIGAVFDMNLLGFIGISYLTFKAVQVLIEIRDGLIEEMGTVEYLYFITFFAVFTSGPIDRSRRFREDFNKVFERGEYADLLAKGIMLLLVGAVYFFVGAALFKMYFSVAPAVFSRFSVNDAICAIGDAYAYGGYLFFDFAGYSLMAMGASYCFGIKTPRNFKAPFIALDIKDFWNRWHMTLSFWLRDYVFMRFTKTSMKHKWFSSRLQTAACGYVINMTLMGAWHGLTVDYLAYGLYHGLLLALTELIQRKSKFYKANKGKTWFKVLSWFVTINLVMFGFALFSGQVHEIVGGLIHG